MKVPKLSPQTVKQILDAADYAEQRVQRGMDPDDALIEAARKFDLSGEQVKLLVQGWNIDKSLSQIKKEENLESKLGPVPVVHYDKIAQSMDQTKSASTQAVDAEEVWYGYYLPPEVPVVRSPVRDEFMEKYGSAVFQLDRASAEVSLKLEKQAKEREELLKKAEYDLQVLENQIVNKLNEIKWAFKVSRADIEAVKENLKVANYRGYQLVCRLEKDLQPPADPEPLTLRYNPSKYPYRTILEGVELLDKYAKARRSYQKLKEVDEEFKDDSRNEPEDLKDPTGAGAGGFYHERINSDKLTSLMSRDEIESLSRANLNYEEDEEEEESDERESKKEAGVVPSLADFAVLARSVGAQNVNEESFRTLERRLYDDVVTKPVTDQVVNFANITVVLSQDPELLNYDPAEVYKTYQELASMAPLAMRNPLVARTMVRQALAQNGLGAFDLNTLAQIEDRLRGDRKRKDEDD